MHTCIHVCMPPPKFVRWREREKKGKQEPERWLKQLVAGLFFWPYQTISLFSLSFLFHPQLGRKFN